MAITLTPPQKLASAAYEKASAKGAGTGAEALEVFASALPEVRLAVAGEAGDFDDDGPRLRAV
jgi:hypothetical protein